LLLVLHLPSGLDGVLELFQADPLFLLCPGVDAELVGDDGKGGLGRVHALLQAHQLRLVPRLLVLEHLQGNDSISVVEPEPEP
jgi:hypothetical protein